MVEILKDPLFIGFLLSLTAAVFIITLINIKLCVILLFFAVALSPKINIAGVPLRVEDFFTIILFFSWFAKMAIKKEPLPSTSLNLPIILYLLTCFVSTAYGYFSGTTELLSSDVSMSAAFHFLKKIEIFLIVYIIVSTIDTKETLMHLVKYILLASAALAFYSTFKAQTEYRISGPIGEGANTLGMYFVFVTIIAIGLFLSKSFRFNRYFLGLFILFYVYVILKTLSRVSYVTFAVTILMLGLFKDKRLLFIPALLVVVIFVLAPHGIVERIDSIGGIFESGEYFHSWEARVWAWRTLPEMTLRESPLFGFGLASMPLSRGESEYVNDFYFTGIFGMLAFIWLYLRVCKIMLFLRKSNDEFINTLALYSLGGFIAYLIGGISGPVFYAIRTANIFWIFVGLLAGAQNLLNKERLNSVRPA